MTALRRVLGVLVAAAVVAAPGCGAESDDDRETIVDATVRVRADGCGPRTELGTGTSIADRLVVTAAHVVAGADRVEIVDRAGTTIAAEVVLFDPNLDVAALRPSSDVGRPALVRNEIGRPGEDGIVALVSAEDTVELVDVEVLQHVSIRTTDIYRDQQVERPGLRIDVAVEPGDSGAMVHLPGGGVGIVWSRSTSTDDQAWTVDLPTELLDASTRRGLVDSVDVGPCL